MFSVLLLAAFAVVAYGQTPQHCSYSPDGRRTVTNNYTWNSWPGDDQNFSKIVDSEYYMGADDFAVGGKHHGKNWETVFYQDKENMRPLGFRYAYLGAHNIPTVCLHAKGAAAYKVELMVYALTTGASLCVKDMNADSYSPQDGGTVAVCDRGEVYACFNADTFNSDLDVAVYCDTDCEDGQAVDLLWRFRRSSKSFLKNQDKTTSQTDMWCNKIAASKDWPSSLTADVPNGAPPGGQNEPAGASAVCTLAALAAASLLVFLH